MQQIAKGIWKISYGTPEKFTPVSMRKSRIAQEGLDAMEKGVLPLEEESLHFFSFQKRSHHHASHEDGGGYLWFRRAASQHELCGKKTPCES